MFRHHHHHRRGGPEGRGFGFFAIGEYGDGPGDFGFGRGRGRGFGRSPDGGSGRGGSGRGGDGEGRGRRRRLFDGEQLRLMVLALIGEESRHGYQLIRAIEERSGGAYAPSPGMVYPLLALLADEGLIREEEGQSARKSFALTEEGIAERDRTATEAQKLLGLLATLAESRRHTDSEPARRAMHNLRNALVARLTREDADSETVFQAVALIDGVAQAIERL